MCDGIASARKLDVAAVGAAVDEAPMTAARAMDLGLLDGLLYRYAVGGGVGGVRRGGGGGACRGGGRR